MFKFEPNVFRSSIRGYGLVKLFTICDTIERDQKRYAGKTDIDSVLRYNAAVEKLKIIEETINEHDA